MWFEALEGRLNFSGLICVRPTFVFVRERDSHSEDIPTPGIRKVFQPETTKKVRIQNKAIFTLSIFA